MWTIEELVEQCALALAGEPQPSGRVNDMPDLRTLRFYTSLGLLDGPSAFRGKKGLYGERQLLQAIAVKRLQKCGVSLADIQAQLIGASDARLRATAQLPSPPSPSPSPSTSTNAPRAFWRVAPAAAAAEAAPLLQAARVAPGVTLVVDGAARAVTAADVDAVRALLVARGLLAATAPDPAGEGP